MNLIFLFEKEILPNLEKELEYSSFFTKQERRKLAEIWFRYFYDTHFYLEEVIGTPPFLQFNHAWKKAILVVKELAPHRTFTQKNIQVCIVLLKDLFAGFQDIYVEFKERERNSTYRQIELMIQHTTQSITQKNMTDTLKEWDQLLENLHSIKNFSFEEHYQQYIYQARAIAQELETKKNILKSEEQKLFDKLQGICSLIQEKWRQDSLFLKSVWWSDFLEKSVLEIRYYLHQRLEKIRYLQKIFGHFDLFSDCGWDSSQGRWQEAQWSILEHFASLVEQDSSIHDLIKILGRDSEDKREQEKENFTPKKLQYRWKPSKGGKSEIKGICQSDNLSHILPSEITLLGNDKTRPIFYHKFAEKKLITYEIDDTLLLSLDNTNHIEPPQESRQAQSGPIILCIDTSTSMQGSPERIAKILTFAVLRLALREERPCYLIAFSDANSIQETKLSHLSHSLDRLVSFLKYSFYGGTDVISALHHAINMLKKNIWQKADILLITDGIFPITEIFNKQINQLKQEKKFSIHSIILNQSIQEEKFSFFDQTWHYSKKGLSKFPQCTKTIE